MIKQEIQSGNREYKVGEFVFVDWKKGKFGPYAKKFRNKMMDQSVGPYEIVEQRGQNWCCVLLSEDPKVVAMFNKEDLTPYVDEDLQNLRANSFEEGGDEPSVVHGPKPNKLKDYMEKAQREKRLRDRFN